MSAPPRLRVTHRFLPRMVPAASFPGLSPGSSGGASTEGGVPVAGAGASPVAGLSWVAGSPVWATAAATRATRLTATAAVRIDVFRSHRVTAPPTPT